MLTPAHRSPRLTRRRLLSAAPALAALASGARVADASAPARPRPPGTVVDHSPASSRQYIGSPSLTVLPGGELVASHDLFGPGSTNDLTLVFASTDRGRTWTKRAEVRGQWWSTLFTYRGGLYLMGTSRENGFAVIRRSTDGGRSWTTPRDARSGLLLADGPYHCAPVPVVEHRGRLWRGMEDAQGPDGWARHFRAFMMSAPADADLLRAESWTCSTRLGWNGSWLNGEFGGWLEGNAVATPEGQMVDILRVDSPEDEERAALVRISADGRRADFDPVTGFVAFPGGCKKFAIRWDPTSRRYWALTNHVPVDQRRGKPASTRNTLALVSSPDLRQWTVRATLLSHPDPEKHGFQYADWRFEGEDLLAVCRTAFEDGLGGAHNQHDANYMTFHRFQGFRTRVDRGAAGAKGGDDATLAAAPGDSDGR